MLGDYSFNLFTLRDATVAALIANNVAAGSVEKSRTLPFGTEELKAPRCIVFLLGVDMDRAGTSLPLEFSDRAQIAIQIGARANSGPALEALLEQQAALALSALLANRNWLDLFEAVQSVRVSYDLPENGKAYEGVASLLVTVTYTTIWSNEVVDNLLLVAGVGPAFGIDLDEGEPGTDMGFSVDLPGAD